MFEDLSRRIDHEIYLATQACLQRLHGGGGAGRRGTSTTTSHVVGAGEAKKAGAADGTATTATATATATAITGGIGTGMVVSRGGAMSLRQGLVGPAEGRARGRGRLGERQRQHGVMGNDYTGRNRSGEEEEEGEVPGPSRSTPRVVHLSRASPRRSLPPPPSLLAAHAVAHIDSRGQSHGKDTSASVVADANSKKDNYEAHLPPGPLQLHGIRNAATATTADTASRVREQVQRHTTESKQQQEPMEDIQEEEELGDPDSLSNITTVTLLVGNLPELKNFYTRVFALTPTHQEEEEKNGFTATFPFNQGRLGVTLAVDPNHHHHHHLRGGTASAALPARRRHRDVGMSVRVEDIEGVWERLRNLREGKGKGRDGNGEEGEDEDRGGDGLRFEGLDATWLQGPEDDEADGVRRRRRRIVFCDPAGYCWEVMEGSC